MLTIRYEDREIIVVEKPQGIEAQSSRSFEPDMVSLIQNHIAGREGREGRDTHKISTNLSTNWGKHSTKPVHKQPPYVAVIHRLDRPVAGIMVYAKTKKAAAALSSQVKEGKMEKTYYAVICGKPVDFVGNYVDYLRKNGKTNRTEIVDKEAEGGKRAELAYQVVETITREQELSLVRIRLLTGRHHQIRVQFAGRGMPLWGDNRYNPEFALGKARGSIALCAAGLSFSHPSLGKKMEYWMQPVGEAFSWFSEINR
ncbi:MAG: RluA family pseudouridine synthase [Lachnospiraceae bacterium]|nr:RluA family pseudouridine synthase [Lachnospiraceae bacterium]